MNGQDLRREPWEARRNVLANLLSDAKAGQLLSEHIDGADGGIVFTRTHGVGTAVAQRIKAQLAPGKVLERVSVDDIARSDFVRLLPAVIPVFFSIALCAAEAQTVNKVPQFDPLNGRR